MYKRRFIVSFDYDMRNRERIGIGVYARDHNHAIVKAAYALSLYDDYRRVFAQEV